MATGLHPGMHYVRDLMLLAPADDAASRLTWRQGPPGGVIDRSLDVHLTGADLSPSGALIAKARTIEYCSS